MTPSLPPPADVSQRSASLRISGWPETDEKGLAAKSNGRQTPRVAAAACEGPARKFDLPLLQQIERKKQGRRLLR